MASIMASAESRAIHKSQSARVYCRLHFSTIDGWQRFLKKVSINVTKEKWDRNSGVSWGRISRYQKALMV